MLSSLSHPTNALLPIDVNEFGILTEVSFAQFWNAELSIILTEYLEKITLDRFMQFLNTPSPIFTHDSPWCSSNSIVCRLLHPQNAPSSMSSHDSGM